MIHPLSNPPASQRFLLRDLHRDLPSRSLATTSFNLCGAPSTAAASRQIAGLFRGRRKMVNYDAVLAPLAAVPGKLRFVDGPTALVGDELRAVPCVSTLSFPCRALHFSLASSL